MDRRPGAAFRHLNQLTVGPRTDTTALFHLELPFCLAAEVSERGPDWESLTKSEGRGRSCPGKVVTPLLRERPPCGRSSCAEALLGRSTTLVPPSNPPVPLSWPGGRDGGGEGGAARGGGPRSPFGLRPSPGDWAVALFVGFSPSRRWVLVAVSWLCLPLRRRLCSTLPPA